MSLFNIIGKDCEKIIMEYKYEMEEYEQIQIAETVRNKQKIHYELLNYFCNMRILHQLYIRRCNDILRSEWIASWDRPN